MGGYISLLCCTPDVDSCTGSPFAFRPLGGLELRDHLNSGWVGSTLKVEDVEVMLDPNQSLTNVGVEPLSFSLVCGVALAVGAERA